MRGDTCYGIAGFRALFRSSSRRRAVAGSGARGRSRGPDSRWWSSSAKRALAGSARRWSATAIASISVGHRFVSSNATLARRVAAWLGDDLLIQERRSVVLCNERAFRSLRRSSSNVNEVVEPPIVARDLLTGVEQGATRAARAAQTLKAISQCGARDGELRRRRAASAGFGAVRDEVVGGRARAIHDAGLRAIGGCGRRRGRRGRAGEDSGRGGKR